jgi:hypothetical protein
MSINRFYTPSLPQYTSQFVEDKTPWDQIMAYDKEKIDRSDKALAYQAETDALTKSLIPGYRTQGDSPVVTDNYKKRMDKWMQDYGESTYSIPALRELTKINADFRSDPLVKKIAQDREANAQRDAMVKDPNYRQETDPNIDQTTGELKPLEGNQFTPYDRPVLYASYEDEMNSELSILKPERRETDPFTKEVKGPPDKNGKPTTIPIWGTETVSQINPESLTNVEEQLVKKYMEKNTPASRYLSAKMGENYNEENVRKLVKEQSTKFANKSIEKQFQALPAGYMPTGRRAGSGTTKKPESTWSGPTPYTSASGVSPSTGVSLDTPKSVGNGPGAIQTWLDNDATKKMFEVTGGPNIEGKDGELYNKYKDNMDVLVNEDKFAQVGEDKVQGIVLPDPRGVFGVKNMAQVVLQRRLFEDPAGTMSMFNAYKQQKESQLAGNGPLKADDKSLRNIKETETFLNRELAKQGITEKPFESDLAFDQAKHAVIQSGMLTMPGSPFKSQEDLFKADMKKLTPWQNQWIKSTMKKVEKNQMNKVGFGTWESLPDADLKKLDDLYFGKTRKEDGTFSADAGNTAMLMGSRIWDTENPNKEVDKDVRDDIFKKNKAAFIEGKLTDESSQFGTGTLILNANGKTYYMTGPDQMSSKKKFENAAYSRDFSNRHGQGDAFAIQGVDPRNFSIGVNDRWSKNKTARSESDVWMAFRDNPNNGKTELILYEGDPETNKKFSEPKSDTNPQGYITQPYWNTSDLHTSSDNNPYESVVTPMDLRYAAIGTHIMVNNKRKIDRANTLYKDNPTKLQEEIARISQEDRSKIVKLNETFGALKSTEEYNIDNGYSNNDLLDQIEEEE